MGLRVLATLLITFLGIIGAISYDAFYALIAYAFWSYTYPEKATWGTLPVQGLSYLTGVILIWMTIMRKKRLFSGHPLNIAIIVFWFMCAGSVFTAGFTDIAMWQFKYFSRVILITLVITALVDDIKRFRYYLWAITIFVGAVAARSGIMGVVGGIVYEGSREGFAGVIADRNFMAVILCSMMPVVFFLMTTERRAWIKVILVVILGGDVLATYLTYARAGFIGMFSSGVFLITKLRRKIFAILIFAVFSALFMTHIVSKAYLERITAVTRIDEITTTDLSAAIRMHAWNSAIRMIIEKPLTGVGFYMSDAEMEKYPDPQTGRVISDTAIHNSVLQVGAEVGLPALLLYFFIFFTGYKMLGKIRRKVNRGLLEPYFLDYASMLQVCFVGFFTSAFFVNAAFIDISWHLIALTIALTQIAHKQEG
ncbi:MAG: O-antigen ligase family protein [Candidatus Omnitrophica bacterium]|nr:O-antigen ligase family protein [Candidatus Omnitrophota bacterium]MCM8791334.1 O-antigen ligase family protein [Candidatus Omnitrophota bacterium]